MMERRQALLITVVLVFVSSAFSFYAGASGLLPQLVAPLLPGGERVQEPVPGASGVNLKKLQQVQEHILQQFVEDVNGDKLTDGALKGMVDAIGDKYSAYFTATEYKRYLEQFEPYFSGIGVTVEAHAKTGLVTVVSPIEGSPGAKAGLLPGDAIIAVDDKDITKMALDEAVMLIRGPKGTKVKLTVRRENNPEPLQFVIARATIEVPNIDYRMIDKEANIGYLRIRHFNEEVAARSRKAIGDLRNQGMTKLILDLRQNPGGLLNEAVDVSSLFLPPKAPVVHIVHRGGKRDTFESKARERWNLPLVVLVDNYSASASEIVAGAIKDERVGVLMGAKTFGKGSVQSFFSLPEGSGIKLTTARYLTSGGHSIHEKGIEPNLTVENPEKMQPGDPGDVQLREAIAYLKKR